MSEGRRDDKSESVTITACSTYQYHKPAVTPAGLTCCVRAGGSEGGMAKREGMTTGACIYIANQPLHILV